MEVRPSIAIVGGLIIGLGLGYLEGRVSRSNSLRVLTAAPAAPVVHPVGLASFQSENLNLDLLVERVGDSDAIVNVLVRRLRSGDDPIRLLREVVRLVDDEVMVMQLLNGLSSAVPLPDALEFAASFKGSNLAAANGLIKGALVASIKKDGFAAVEALLSYEASDAEMWLAYAEREFTRWHPSKAIELVRDGKLKADASMVAQLLVSSPEEYYADGELFSDVTVLPQDFSRVWSGTSEEERAKLYEYLMKDKNHRAALSAAQSIGGPNLERDLGRYFTTAILDGRGVSGLLNLVKEDPKLFGTAIRAGFAKSPDIGIQILRDAPVDARRSELEDYGRFVAHESGDVEELYPLLSRETPSAFRVGLIQAIGKIGEYSESYTIAKEHLTDDELRDWQVAVLPHVGKDHPDLALSDILDDVDAMGADKRLSVTFDQVFGRWTLEQPFESWRWLADNSTLVPMDRIQSNYREWLKRDSMEASRFVEETGDPELRDAFAVEISSYLISKDPEYAMLWAQTIGDRVAREQLLEHIRSVE